jgi:hypothetical protein
MPTVAAVSNVPAVAGVLLAVRHDGVQLGIEALCTGREREQRRRGPCRAEEISSHVGSP